MKKTAVLIIVLILLAISVNAGVIQTWGKSGVNNSWADSTGNFWMVNLSAVLYNNISFTTSTEDTTEILDICLGGSGSDCKFVNKTGMQLTTSTILWFLEVLDTLKIYTNQTKIEFNQTVNFSNGLIANSVTTPIINSSTGKINASGNNLTADNIYVNGIFADSWQYNNHITDVRDVIIFRAKDNNNVVRDLKWTAKEGWWGWSSTNAALFVMDMSMKFNDNNAMVFGGSNDASLQWTTTGEDRFLFTSPLTDFTGNVTIGGDLNFSTAAPVINYGAPNFPELTFAGTGAVLSKVTFTHSTGGELSFAINPVSVGFSADKILGFSAVDGAMFFTTGNGDISLTPQTTGDPVVINLNANTDVDGNLDVTENVTIGDVLKVSTITSPTKIQINTPLVNISDNLTVGENLKIIGQSFLGTASGGIGNKDFQNILLYDVGGNNWAGIQTKGTGDMVFSVGTSTRYTPLELLAETGNVIINGDLNITGGQGTTAMSTAGIVTMGTRTRVLGGGGATDFLVDSGTPSGAIFAFRSSLNFPIFYYSNDNAMQFRSADKEDLRSGAFNAHDITTFTIDIDGNAWFKGTLESARLEIDNITADRMALGSNTLVGLSSGDGNVSTLFYNTLTPKSCIVFELGDGMIVTRCKGGEWVECNPSIKDDCPIESENKMLGIYEKRENEATCKSNSYSWDGDCFEIVTSVSNYNEAVEIIQIPETETEIINSTCSRQTDTLQIEEYDCEKTIKTETGKLIDSYKYKEGCGWDENLLEYYCKERVSRNSEIGIEQ